MRVLSMSTKEYACSQTPLMEQEIIVNLKDVYSLPLFQNQVVIAINAPNGMWCILRDTQTR